jgi:hypothetical protein
MASAIIHDGSEEKDEVSAVEKMTSLRTSDWALFTASATA